MIYGKTGTKSKILYTIDQKNRKVTATLQDVERDVQELLIKHFDISFIEAGTMYPLDAICDTFELAPFYSGTAKCDPNDRFDVEKGMEIARRRALKKYYKARGKLLSQFIEVVELKLTELERIELNWVTQAINNSMDLTDLEHS